MGKICSLNFCAHNIVRPTKSDVLTRWDNVFYLFIYFRATHNVRSHTDANLL